MSTLERVALDFLRGNPAARRIDPDVVLQFVSSVAPAERLPILVKKTLYDGIRATGKMKMVPADVYKDNDTLNAVISFCAAPHGSSIASGSRGRSRWDVNRKVGGVLTTNYDNLVEGACNSKYKGGMLQPVAREGGRPPPRGRRVIPVYHVHGYVSYVEPDDWPKSAKASEALVVAEDDYYRTFYNLLGFGNVAAASLLRGRNSVRSQAF